MLFMATSEFEEQSLRIDSISYAHRLMGLRAPEHSLISLIETKDIIPFDLKENITITLGLYIISMKYKLGGSFLYGRSSYDFEEGTLVFMEPGQQLRHEPSGRRIASDLDTSDEGWILLFHPDLLRRSRLADNMKRYSFFGYDSHEALHASEKEKDILSGIITTLRHEYSVNQDEHSRVLILTHLELLLNYCLRFYSRQFMTRKNENQDYVRRLERFLYAYCEEGLLSRRGIPTLGDCAEEFHLSPNYLSDLLRKETGKGTIEFIQRFLVERAKSRLLDGREAVKEIAYDLGFETPQYFSRVFKKRTGLTPSEFRNRS